MNLDPLAGRPRLVSVYDAGLPDPDVAAYRVAIGISGHRGASFQTSFNEHHVLAIRQATCAYRARPGSNGPLFSVSIPMRARCRRAAARSKSWPPTAST